MTKRFLPFLLPLLALAACGSEGSKDDRTASGEVLEGTISDAMLPLDTVKSQAPLADPGAARKAAGATPAPAEGEGAAPAEGAAAPAPASTGEAPKPGFGD